MKGVYVAQADMASFTGNKTAIQVKAGASVAVEILRAWVSQYTLDSDDRFNVRLLRKTAAATVSSLTPVLLSPGDQAAASVGGTSATGFNASAEGTNGDTVLTDGASALAGWLYLPVPEERIIVEPAGIIALHVSAVTSASYVCGVVFREIG